MFESRRRANARQRTAQKAAAVLAFVAFLLLLLGVASSWFAFYYVALVLFVLAGTALASGSGTWGVGAKGEETVAEQLIGLGDLYQVVHDVVLPGAGGNVDHVVMGPNGVFAIETKNHNGFITCNGDYWTQRKVGRRGTPYMGNIGCPSRQVKRNAVQLRDFIQERLGMNLYVNSIVVFTNQDAFLRIENPTVTVVRPNELCHAIKMYNSRTSLNTKELEELETAIRPLSQFHQ